MDLLTETRKLIELTDISKKDICLGADVQRRWLDYLIDDLDRDFRIMAVQRVYDFLSLSSSNDCQFNKNKTTSSKDE